MTIRNVAPWALTPLLGVGVGCHLCTVTGCGLPFNNLILSGGFHAEISLGYNTTNRSWHFE